MFCWILLVWLLMRLWLRLLFGRLGCLSLCIWLCFLMCCGLRLGRMLLCVIRLFIWFWVCYLMVYVIFWVCGLKVLKVLSFGWRFLMIWRFGVWVIFWLLWLMGWRVYLRCWLWCFWLLYCKFVLFIWFVIVLIMWVGRIVRCWLLWFDWFILLLVLKWFWLCLMFLLMGCGVRSFLLFVWYGVMFGIVWFCFLFLCWRFVRWFILLMLLRMLICSYVRLLRFGVIFLLMKLFLSWFGLCCEILLLNGVDLFMIGSKLWINLLFFMLIDLVVFLCNFLWGVCRIWKKLYVKVFWVIVVVWIFCFLVCGFVVRCNCWLGWCVFSLVVIGIVVIYCLLVCWFWLIFEWCVLGILCFII